MENMRRFVMGDIHGELDKLKECLELVNFDFEKDQLIQLGDVIDRGLYSYECVELLLKIKNLIAIRGNHDDCFLEYLLRGKQNVLWNQGGKETYESYYRNCGGGLESFPKEHINFFKNQLPYYIDKDNNCFVHGGFNRELSLDNQVEISDLWWDRNLWNTAINNHEYKIDKLSTIEDFNIIFIGHTPTVYYDSNSPMKRCNIWNLDTGCGKGGVLTIMNVDTKEWFQSK